MPDPILWCGVPMFPHRDSLWQARVGPSQPRIQDMVHLWGKTLEKASLHNNFITNG